MGEKWVRKAGRAEQHLRVSVLFWFRAIPAYYSSAASYLRLTLRRVARLVQRDDFELLPKTKLALGLARCPVSEALFRCPAEGREWRSRQGAGYPTTMKSAQVTIGHQPHKKVTTERQR